MDVAEAVEDEADGCRRDVVFGAAEVGVSVLPLEHVQAVKRGHPLGRTDGGQHGAFQLPPRVELPKLFDRFVLKWKGKSWVRIPSKFKTNSWYGRDAFKCNG